MEWLLLLNYLPDGNYKIHGKLKWHERLRLKIALILYNSIPRPYDYKVKTETGFGGAELYDNRYS